jgi:hypothetical protein
MAQSAILPARRRRGRSATKIAVLLGISGLVLSGIGIFYQLAPRRFTAAQQHRIEAWDVAQRWRTTPKAKLFPARARYELAGLPLGVPGSLHLQARRLGIARQATCASAADAGRQIVAMLDHDGCQAVLRATYTDATSSMVLTVGVAVLGSEGSAVSAAHFLTGGVAKGQGDLSHHLVLRPVPVHDSPAAAFHARQRQLSWVASSGSYLVLATAGFADGRPRVPVASDSYTYEEMTSLARGVTVDIAGPLGTQPPAPKCPGEPGC